MEDFTLNFTYPKDELMNLEDDIKRTMTVLYMEASIFLEETKKDIIFCC